MNLTIAVKKPHVVPIVESRTVPLVFEVEDLTFNGVQQTVKKGGEALPLSPMRYTMLFALGRNAYRRIEQPLAKCVLMHEMYGDMPPKSNCFDVHIWRLRRTLEKAGSVLVIRSFYGTGFKLVVPRQKSAAA